MGPRLGRVEYPHTLMLTYAATEASMGPRLGRVEYETRLFSLAIE